MQSRDRLGRGTGGDAGDGVQPDQPGGPIVPRSSSPADRADSYRGRGGRGGRAGASGGFWAVEPGPDLLPARSDPGRVAVGPRPGAGTGPGAYFALQSDYRGRDRVWTPAPGGTPGSP